MNQHFVPKKGKVVAKTGDTILVTLGGGVHAFKNKSEKHATLICTVGTSGFDQMFEEIHTAGPPEAKVIGEKFVNRFYPADYFEKNEK